VALNELIAGHTSRYPSAEWIRRLVEAGVPCGEINTIDEVFADPQVRHLGMARATVSHERGPTQLVGQPIDMSRSQSEIRRPSPGFGEHTAEVLGEAGFTSDEIDALERAGAIRTAGNMVTGGREP
jgi:crotonobetainyl-CoA:carnitine CoA-transferase CaiB-like acyl-CoA transferase